MKKKILIVILIILSFIIAIKTREIIILNKINSSIIDFKNQENRYYCIDTIMQHNINSKKEIFIKNNIKKHVLNTENIGKYIEMENLLTGDIYVYNYSKKIKYNIQNIKQTGNNFADLPRIISIMSMDVKSKISQLFKIHYIMPTTYENKPCYKISTNFEIVIIDKETYLPVYSSIKTVNSGEIDNSTEYIYKFEVNTVTDEDVALPDFSDYTIE